MQKQHKLED